MYHGTGGMGGDGSYRVRCDRRIDSGFKGRKVGGRNLRNLYARYKDCHDAVADQHGHAKMNDVLAEMRTRDALWLNKGIEPAPVFEKPEARLEPKERRAIKYLSSHGFALTVLLEDLTAAASIDLRMGGAFWELKSPGSGRHAVEDRLRDGVKKWEKLHLDEPRIVLCNSESSREDAEVLNEFTRRCAYLGVHEGLFVSHDGASVRRWKA